MFFNVVPYSRDIPTNASNQAFLVQDNWDDWYSFRTQFYLIVIDNDGKRFEPGSVKIGQFGLAGGVAIGPGTRAPEISNYFDMLGERFFSLGQGENYYETLHEIDQRLRKKILKGLRDCAFDLRIFDKALNEQVMQRSLLREVPEVNVRNRLHRLARGDAELTKFEFAYLLPSLGLQQPPPPKLTFTVEPYSTPPTNVHVLVGRNGVGKTRCMYQLSRALLGYGDADDPAGEIKDLSSAPNSWSFAGLILVSFSAFDDLTALKGDRASIRFAVIGQSQQDMDQTDGEVRAVRSSKDFRPVFGDSFEKCRRGLRSARWRAAVNTLENDPLFAEANVTALLNLPDDQWREQAEKLFGKLSSGHAIVLLTITRLVELVDERTLILLDEPESHLHPPLLSAFIRSLADLLIKRNGVAIVATHSPVVLQEVPKSCVWKLRRSGAISVAERPQIETFGENVGILTREVFGLEVTTAGFHQLLKHATTDEGANYEAVLNLFNHQLGGEARAILKAMIASRTDADESTS
jgi:hypothetical protein